MASIPNPTDETSVLMSPLELCPMEVWYNEIFPNLHTVDDRIALYNTCKLFRNLLEGSKHLWILPAILPNLYEYLDKNSALTVRRVCKKWSKSLDEHLDSFYKDEFTYFNEDTKNFKIGFHHRYIIEPRPSPRLEDGCVLHDVTGVRALLQKVRNAENPMTSLPGGKFVVSLDCSHLLLDDDHHVPETVVVEVLTGLVTILKAVGESIRYLDLLLYARISLNQETSIEVWLYRYLLQYLLEVSNLRFLKLSVETDYLNDNTNPDRRRREMVEAINRHPLPLAPHLEYFEPTRYFVGNERTPIEDYLFQHYANASVKWNWIGSNYPVHGPPPGCLATLKELFYHDSDHGQSIGQSNGESIREFAAPRLTTLRLTIDRYETRIWPLGPVNVTTLLESLLNHSFPAMENLSIECARRHGFKQLSPIPGNMTCPSVTTLRLAVSGEISYHFLSCFPSLERFYVFNEQLTFGPQQLPLTESQHEAGKWFDFERLEHSRAWKALPNLKFLSFNLAKEEFEFRIRDGIFLDTLETRECRRSRLM